MTIMIPKWIGSVMPKLLTTGRKIGAKIRTAGVMSMNMPMTSRMRLMSSRMTYLLSDTLISALPMAAGQAGKGHNEGHGGCGDQEHDDCGGLAGLEQDA